MIYSRKYTYKYNATYVCTKYIFTFFIHARLLIVSAKPKRPNRQINLAP